MLNYNTLQNKMLDKMRLPMKIIITTKMKQGFFLSVYQIIKNKHMKRFFFIVFGLATLIQPACHHENAESENQNDFIEIKKSQFESENMELGVPSYRTFTEKVPFTGKIVTSANGLVKISLPLTGIVQHFYCNEGQKVQKGQVLLNVSGNEMIDIQKEYAESSAILKKLSSEYERIKELYKENIGTQKELISAESVYKAEKAKNMALRMKLKTMHLEPEKIEDALFSHTYPLKSPINGYITKIHAKAGQYTEQHSVVMEILDEKQFLIKLSLFTKDINKLKTNQKIQFNFIDNKGGSYSARLSTLNKTINEESKTLDCLAEIEDSQNMNIINNQFVEGYIIVDTLSLISVPLEALVKTENETFILNLEKEENEIYYFSKIRVITGISNQEFVALQKTTGIHKILLKGVYNLQID
jgi:membrane fusion protein, heavy metal efflux system